MMMFGKQGKRFTSTQQQGQGVVEYAGALVIAALLISLAIFIVPDEVAGMVNNIMITAVEFCLDSLNEGFAGA